MTDSAACVLAHIALHKQLHPNLTDAIPAVIAALCKEIDTEEQLCDGDVTCEYVCQPAVEFLAHMASQSANLIDIGLANGIEALARAVAVEPGKQRVTERSILALNLIASGGPSFSNAVARWRNVTNFRNQIGRAAILCASLILCLNACGPLVRFLWSMVSRAAYTSSFISHAPTLQSTNDLADHAATLSHTTHDYQKHALLTDQMIWWCADRYVAAQAPLTGPRLDAFVTAHQGPLAELDYENICRQVQHTFIHPFIFFDCSIHSFFLSFILDCSIHSFFLDCSFIYSSIHPSIHPSVHAVKQPLSRTTAGPLLSCICSSCRTEAVQAQTAQSSKCNQ